MRPMKRGLLLVTGALIAGGTGVMLGERHLEQRARAIEDDLRNEHATRSVIVARDDLPKGTRLTRDHVALREIPATFTHDRALLNTDWSAIAGRTLETPVSAGRSILPTHLTDAQRSRLADQINAGDRAMTIPVSGGADIGGLLAPGDRIDLMLTHRGGGERETVPLLADIPILATGAQLVREARGADAGRYDDLTLSVSPVEAARITHALAIGRIHVVLRADTDQAPVETYRIDARTLTGAAATDAGPAADIELIIGGQP